VSSLVQLQKEAFLRKLKAAQMEKNVTGIAII
jgi:hypothetical protein